MNTKDQIFSSFKPKPQGFTIMELMIVVVILGVISALAFPVYTNMMETQYCKTAKMNLVAINTAAKIYKIKHGTYVLPSGGTDLSAINNDLHLNIDDPKFTYTYTNSSVTTFFAFAERTGGPTYSCNIYETDSSPSTYNPNCNNTRICGTPPQMGPMGCSGNPC